MQVYTKMRWQLSFISVSLHQNEVAAELPSHFGVNLHLLLVLEAKVSPVMNV